MESPKAMIEVSVVLPCLNEAKTVGGCVQKAIQCLCDNQISGEVIVADNGSTDGSQEIARELGARVIDIHEKGYGNALMGGINASSGLYIIMADSDDSYDLTKLMPFIEKLRQGYDLVMGNRFQGGIEPGAMPWHHKYIGNPVLTGIGKLLFHSQAGDFHSGLRGFNKQAYLKMDLRTTGMEFASEMVIKATIMKMSIAEIPIILHPDGRMRPPHLRSFRDGWRHLRFMLMYSPRWLFLYPGGIFALLGLAVTLWLLPGPRHVGAIVLDIHTMLYAFAAVILGFQSILFSLFTKVFTVSEGLQKYDQRFDRLAEYLSLENGIILGTLLTIMGLGGSFYAFFQWEKTSFGPLNPSLFMRIAIPAVMTFVLGIQMIFGSFFLGVLKINRK